MGQNKNVLSTNRYRGLCINGFQNPTWVSQTPFHTGIPSGTMQASTRARPSQQLRYITSSFTASPRPGDGGLSLNSARARDGSRRPRARQVCTGSGEKSSPTSQNWTRV
uniref:Uncharacterized protein n=1 Tax=Arundo donax TaxID=35708 RepID=A0A0A9EWL7_ARUDO